jgi:hypothetical protein
MELMNWTVSAGFFTSVREVFFSSFFGKSYYNFYKRSIQEVKMKLATFIHTLNQRIRFYLWGKRQQIYIGIGVVLGISLLISYALHTLALNKVMLVADGNSYTWKTLSANVEGVLREKNVTLNDGDVVKPDLKAAVTDKLNIEVIRAFPVIIKTSDNSVNYNTITQTVRELLEQAKIEFSPDDKVSPGLDTIVKPYKKFKSSGLLQKLLHGGRLLNPRWNTVRIRSWNGGFKKKFAPESRGLPNTGLK